MNAQDKAQAQARTQLLALAPVVLGRVLGVLEWRKMSFKTTNKAWTYFRGRPFWVRVLVLSLPLIAVGAIAHVTSLQSFILFVFPESYHQGIQHFLGWVRGETRGFLLLFLIAAIWQSQLRDESIIIRDTDREAVKQYISVARDLNTPEGVSRYIAKHFYQTENYENFRRVIFGPASAFKDAYVRMTLASDTPDSDILYKLELAFVARLERFVVALVRDNISMDRLCDLPKIADIRIVADLRDDEERAVEQFLASYSVEAGPDDGTLLSKLKFQRSPRSRYRELLSSIDEPTRRHVVLVEAKVPEPDAQKTFVCTDPMLSVGPNAPYIFWASNRPMFLQRIEIDATRLNKPARRIFLHPNLPGVSVPHDLGANIESIVTVRVNQWVFYGHGISVGWRPYN